MSEPYRADNLLDRISDPATLQLHYDHLWRRERELVDRLLAPSGGAVLSVGCGWHPGRHLFPRPRFRITGVEPDGAVVAALLRSGELDAGRAGAAGDLPFPDESFDFVLYRLVLHHVVYRQALAPVFEEARRLLRPGGALIAIEPGLWHPVGAALALANGLRLGPLLHGTPDDVPLSPRALLRDARAAGLAAELHAVTYTWRRMPVPLQLRLQRLDRHGSRRGLRALGHTLLLIARR